MIGTERPWKATAQLISPTPQQLGRVSPPLLERITHPAEEPYTVNEFKSSILSSLSDLLNTRSFYTLAEVHALDPLLITHRHPALYGMDPMIPTAAEGRAAWPHIAGAIQTKIALFEPRLQNPSVQIIDFEGATQTLHLSIQGTALYNGAPISLSFELHSLAPTAKSERAR